MKTVVSFIRRIFKEEGYVSVHQTNLFVFIIIVSLSLLFSIITVLAIPRDASPFIFSVIFTIYALVFLLLYFLDTIWEPFWQTVLDSNLEIARRTNRIKYFEPTIGNRENYGRMLIDVKWETGADSFAELRVWRSDGESHLRDSVDDLIEHRKDDDAKQIGIARNGESLTCKDAEVRNGKTVNYYAWIHLPESKTKNSGSEGVFPKILDGIDFRTKQEVFSLGERKEDYLKRQIRVGELKAKAEPPTLPSPPKMATLAEVVMKGLDGANREEDELIILTAIVNSKLKEEGIEDTTKKAERKEELEAQAMKIYEDWRRR